MNRNFSKCGLIVLVVLALVSFYFASPAVAQVKDPSLPVKVTNTPLPVTVPAASRDMFTLQFYVAGGESPATNYAGAHVNLPKPAIIETVSALCDVNALITLRPGSSFNSGITLTPVTEPTGNAAYFFPVIGSPQLVMEMLATPALTPATIHAPTGTSLDITVSPGAMYPTGGEVLCRVVVIVEYTP